MHTVLSSSSISEAEEPRVYVRRYEGQERLSLRMTVFIVQRDKIIPKTSCFELFKIFGFIMVTLASKVQMLFYPPVP